MAQYTLKQKLLSYLFYFRLVLVSFLYCFTVGLGFAAVALFQTGKRRQITWRWAIKYYGKTVLALYGYPYIKIRYQDLAPEENEPGVFILNHRSGSDGFLAAFLPGGVIQAINDWPFKLFFFGIFARLGGYFNIKGMPWERFLQEAGSCIAQDRFSVVGFPEGTRSGCSRMGKFHGALFRLAQEARCPVYPVVVMGNDKIPDLNFVMHSGTIEIFKLPSVKPEEFADWSAYKLKNHVKDQMAAKIKELDERTQ